tara:strand:- start:3410 stop:3616 length:207 start_codon:yes stop_codon:yes gene_type:complete
MFIGFFIIGFIVGYIVGTVGGVSIAQQNEAEAIQRGTKAVQRFKATRSKPPAGEQDYHADVPTAWRDA